MSPPLTASSSNSKPTATPSELHEEIAYRVTERLGLDYGITMVWPQTIADITFIIATHPAPSMSSKTPKSSTPKKREDKVISQAKRTIDQMDYETLLRHWRFNPVNDPLFRGTLGAYFWEAIQIKRTIVGEVEHARIVALIHVPNRPPLRSHHFTTPPHLDHSQLG